MELVEDPGVVGGPRVHQRDHRERGRVGVACVREEPLRRRRVERRQEVRVAAAGDAGRDHPGRRQGVAAVGEAHDASPVHRLRESAPDPRVVERRPARVEPEVGHGEVGRGAQLRPKRPVEPDPGCVLGSDRGPVQGPRPEDVNRGLPAEVRDQRHAGERWRARPVVIVRRQLELCRGLPREDVGTRCHETGSRPETRSSVHDPGWDHRQRWAGRDRREVTGRARQLHLEDTPVRMKADGSRVGRCSGGVRARTDHVVQERRERRRSGRVQDAEPAPHDVLGADRRPIREREPIAEREIDGPVAVLEGPARGERRARREAAVDRREPLEELGNHRRAPCIAGRGGIDGGRRRHGDSRLAVGALDPAARCERQHAGKRNERDDAEDRGATGRADPACSAEQGNHRAEYRSARGGPGRPTRGRSAGSKRGLRVRHRRGNAARRERPLPV